MYRIGVTCVCVCVCVRACVRACVRVCRGNFFLHEMIMWSKRHEIEVTFYQE